MDGVCFQPAVNQTVNLPFMTPLSPTILIGNELCLNWLLNVLVRGLGRSGVQATGTGLCLWCR